MDVEFIKARPGVKSTKNQELEVVDRDFPRSFQQIIDSPNLPRDFFKEPKHLGDTFRQLYRAATNRRITGLISTPVTADSSEWSIRHIETHVLHSKDATYGGVGDVAKISSEWMYGNLGSQVVGIKMPRGGIKDLERIGEYKAWFQYQVDACLDAIERWEQLDLWKTALNNRDQLLSWLSKQTYRLNLTVGEYLEKFENNIVNVVRTPHSFAKMNRHSNEQLRTYFTGAEDQTGEWIWVISPDSDAHIKYERPELVLHLYAGNIPPAKGGVGYPGQISIYEANTTKVQKNLVYVHPNMLVEGETLPKNILQVNREHSNYYVFRNWGSETAFYSDVVPPVGRDYDIAISDDADETPEKRLSYQRCTRFILDNFKFKSERGVEYYLNDFLRESFGSDTYSKTQFFRALRGQLLSQIREIVKPDDSEVQIAVKQLVHLGSKLKTAASTDEKMCVLKFYTFAEKDLPEDVEDFEKSLLEDVWRLGVMDCGNIFKFLFRNKFDLPFITSVFKRRVFEVDDALKIRKHSIEKLEKKMLVSGHQDAITGTIFINLFKESGARLTEPRNVQRLKSVFIKKCVAGGNLNLYVPNDPADTGADYDDDVEDGFKKTLKYGLYPIPLLISNTHLKKRDKGMIDRNGIDDVDKYDQALQDNGLTSSENHRKYYYHFWKEAKKLFNWGNDEITLNRSEISLDKRKYEATSQHWPGRQRFLMSDSLGKTSQGLTLNEEGPFKKHFKFWKDIAVDNKV